MFRVTPSFEFRVSSSEFELETRYSKPGSSVCKINAELVTCNPKRKTRNPKPETGSSPSESFHRDPLHAAEIELPGSQDRKRDDFHELIPRGNEQVR